MQSGRARTTPEASTTAMVEFDVCHTTGRPVRMAPFASLSVAVSRTVDPGATVVSSGETATEAIGAGDIPSLHAAPARSARSSGHGFIRMVLPRCGTHQP